MTNLNAHAQPDFESLQGHNFSACAVMIEHLHSRLSQRENATVGLFHKGCNYSCWWRWVNTRRLYHKFARTKSFSEGFARVPGRNPNA